MEKTAQEVIETKINGIPATVFPKTVDTLKIGDPHQVVTGFAITQLEASPLNHSIDPFFLWKLLPTKMKCARNALIS